jgi:UDP-glucuronate 4-epimerase
VDITDRARIRGLFEQHSFDAVLHMAAQAGVRHSIDHPHDYADANLAGLLNILEACRHQKPQHFLFASSSSVYGERSSGPFSESDQVEHPISLYAATKKAGELMAHAYSHLYGLATSCLRFFTVYGPWGRPDMAYFKFADAICAGETIELYNNGEMKRDFSYIDDVVDGVLKVLEKPPTASVDGAAYRILNVGRGDPVELMEFVAILEAALGKKAQILNRPMQPGDVTSTWADTKALQQLCDFEARVTLSQGLQRFAHWYLGEWQEQTK